MVIHSFSSISTYNQCPRKFEELYIHRRWKDKSREISRGDIIHKELEEYLLGKRKERPTVEPKDGLLDLLVKAKAQPELSLAVAADMKPVGFWSKGARLRGKLDVVIAGREVLAWDWKTGKRRDNSLQADVYYTLLRGNYPKADTIKVVFDYLDKGRQPPYEPNRTAVMRVTETMDRIDRARAFPPRPSPLCGWCSVESCEYWEERK